jgi:hypothetical protein
MSIQLKIVNATRSGTAPRLCDTCTNGVITRGVSDSEEQVFCSFMAKPVSMRVTDCNRYTDGGKPSLWDMRRIAWVLDTSSGTQRYGFLPAAEWQEKHEDEELLPEKL